LNDWSLESNRSAFTTGALDRNVAGTINPQTRADLSKNDGGLKYRSEHEEQTGDCGQLNPAPTDRAERGVDDFHYRCLDAGCRADECGDTRVAFHTLTLINPASNITMSQRSLWRGL
jgi:hypothetical protein